MNEYWRCLIKFSGHPLWVFIARARLQRQDRAMLTVVWFLLGEKWYA